MFKRLFNTFAVGLALSMSVATAGFLLTGCEEAGSATSDTAVVDDNGGSTDSTVNQDTSTVAAKWRCTVCDWVYDPAKGDPTQGIPAGTRFEDLPDTWKCPECKLGKDVFVKIE